MTDHVDVPLSDNGMDLIDRMQRAKAALKAWKEEESEVRTLILQEAQHDGESNIQLVTEEGVPVLTVTVSERTTVDRKKLEARFPEVFEEVISASPVVTVKLLDV